MPIGFEVTANNCEIASQVLDAGIKAYSTVRDLDSEFAYTCLEKGSSISAWELALYVYAVALLCTLVGWIYFYHRGATADRLLKWGIVSVVFPVVGTLVALLNFGDSNQSLNTSIARGKWSQKDQPSADDSP